MKTLRFIALILVLCTFATLFLACNREETPSQSTSESTSATTKPSSSDNNSNSGNNNTDDNTGNNNSNNQQPSTPNVDASKLVDSVNIKDYNGTRFDEKYINLGQGTYMNIVKNSTPEEFKEFKSKIEADGLVLYTSNTIGKNEFYTYVTKKQIITVMFLAYDYDETDSEYPATTSIDHNEVRVIVDDPTTFSLPGLSDDNKYTPNNKVEPKLIILSDNAVTWPGRMGYIYKLSDGSFFIIDGGYTKSGGHGNSSEPYIMSVLEKYADDPNNITIAAWLISHVHSDHLGGFLDMSANTELKKRIHIEKVIYNMPCEADLSEQDLNSNGTTTMVKWGDKLENAIIRWSPDAVIKAHPGQVFHIRNLKLTIYHSQDLMLGTPLTSSNPKLVYKSIKVHNNTSIVSKVDFMGKTALYLADSSAQANKSVLDPVYNTSLQADIVQVAHHGYGDTSAGNVYKHITPSIVFWPVCKQHYDGLNHDGSIYYEKGSAYSGVNRVGFNVEYLFKDGIRHYYHGGDCITFSDFETWKGVRWDAIP